MSITPCDESVFQNALPFLEQAWTKYWTTSSTPLPNKFGIVFGRTCHSVCGSIGFRGVTGLQALQPDWAAWGTPAAKKSFTTCASTDYGIYVVPFTAGTITADVDHRATGTDVLWPQAPNGHTTPVTIDVNGFLVFSVPLEITDTNTTDVKFKSSLVSVRLALNYATGLLAPAWPDAASTLFPFVPFADALGQYEASLNEYAEKLTNQMQAYVTSHMVNTTEPCEVQETAAQTCSAGTTMPGQACNACDTCCRCLVQQRCDGECSSCPCITCNAFNYEITFLLAVLFIVVFLVAYAVLRFSKPEKRTGAPRELE